MEEPVRVMRDDVVFPHMKRQEERGKLSKAHSYDHVSNVSAYAGRLVTYFGEQLGVEEPERLVPYAQMTGLSHDIVRYASQTESGEDASADFLRAVYDTHFAGLVLRDDFERFVVDVVRNSDYSFPRMREIYAEDPEALSVALAVVAGDKLLEASGPRVLERRSFFVGRERMKNPEDLGAVFDFPSESVLGILTETMVRLGSVNHVSNYESDPALLALAQRLHAPQYHWYAGMLGMYAKMSGIVGEDERAVYEALTGRLRGNEKTVKLAERLENKGARLIEEKHLDGEYFARHGLLVLKDAVDNVPEDAAESSSALIDAFVSVERPEDAIRSFEESPSGPVTFQGWMRDIAAYRRGEFNLLEGLEAS